MMPINIKRLLAFVPLLFFVTTAFATDVVFQGSGGYSISSTQSSVSVNFSRIQNISQNTTSGSLYIQLWASPDNNPAGSGYSLTRNLSISNFNGGGNGTLRPGASFTNIRINTTYNAPPRGRYYVFLILAEYPNINSILDYEAADGNPTTLGSGGSDEPDPTPDPDPVPDPVPDPNPNVSGAGSDDSGGGGSTNPLVLFLSCFVFLLRNRRRR